MSKSKIYGRKGWDFGSFVMFDNPEDCWDYAKERSKKMFEQIKAAEAAKEPDLQEFLALYAKFQAGARWLAERQAKWLDNAPHLKAFRELESDIDQQWDKITEEQKESILAALVASGAINKEVSLAKELFSGQLVKIT